jgi:hypothetical protein
MIVIRRRPFLVRFINSYRAWRVFGMIRRDALAAAWIIST